MERISAPVGRFAPSPSGRMHLGNVYAALMSWLSVRRRGGRWILRIEDIDPQRSREQYAQMIRDDLRWLGLEWDEEYTQSQRMDIYEDALAKLREMGLTYPCRCTRADIMATQAPHASDGRVVYSGKCRPCAVPPFPASEQGGAVRIYAPDREITFSDRFQGSQTFNLARDCGDFVLRRADGAWAYQLAVTVDDATMGITEVVRGLDLLPSTAQQIYLATLLGYPVPEYAHIPLLTNEQGQRLSKRDASLGMDVLRRQYTAEEILGLLAFRTGLSTTSAPVTAYQLLEIC